MKLKKSFVIGVAAAILICSFVLDAQTSPKNSSSPTPTSSAAESPAKQAARPLPFHGMISSVDQKAKTFSISGKQKSHIFKVTEKTTIMKGANAATMNELVENEEVSGSYWKNPDGSLEAKTVKLGPVGAAKKATASPSPSASPKPKF